MTPSEWERKYAGALKLMLHCNDVIIKVQKLDAKSRDNTLLLTYRIWDILCFLKGKHL
jgi:hypothetical protein